MARVWVQRLSDPFHTAAGYLKWKDIQISGTQDGKSFIASIRFNWWKSWTEVRQDSYHPLSRSLLKYRKRILIRAPHTIDNINLSIPHRLLALIFNRNLLCDDSPDTGVLTLLQGSNTYRYQNRGTRDASVSRDRETRTNLNRSTHAIAFVRYLYSISKVEPQSPELSQTTPL